MGKSKAKNQRGPWRIHFFQRHKEDDPNEPVPARDFLLGCPSLVLISGMDKAFRTTFLSSDYEPIQKLRREYLARSPRSVTPVRP